MTPLQRIALVILGGILLAARERQKASPTEIVMTGVIQILGAVIAFWGIIG